jgi:hypothetical protein
MTLELEEQDPHAHVSQQISIPNTVLRPKLEIGWLHFISIF